VRLDARRQAFVVPVQLVVNAQILPEGADNGAQPPVIGSAESNLMALMRVAQRLVPGGARRVAGRDQAVCRFGTVALVVVRINTARIVGVVLNRLDVTHEIRACIHRLERADAPIEHPGGVLELVLVEGRIEQRDRLRRKRYAVRARRHLVEHALGIHILVALRDEGVPVIVDLPQGRNAQALVGHRIDRVSRHQVVVKHGAIGRNLARPRWRGCAAGRIVRKPDAAVGRFARESARYVVDVTAAPVVIDHSAHRQGIGDQRQIEHRCEVGIGVTARGHAIRCGDVPLSCVELRLVGDVANDARLSPGTEERSLGPCEDFDPLEISGVHIQVSARELTRLLIQIEGNVRKAVDRASGLSGHASGAEAPHEDLHLTGPLGCPAHVRQMPDQVLEGRDIQPLQRLAA